MEKLQKVNLRESSEASDGFGAYLGWVSSESISYEFHGIGIKIAQKRSHLEAAWVVAGKDPRDGRVGERRPSEDNRRVGTT